MRTETDSIGSVSLAQDRLYGIHTCRALENFPPSGEQIHPLLIKYYLLVKKACAVTNHKIKLLPDQKFSAISSAIDTLLVQCQQLIEKGSPEIYQHICVDPYQGGAGTSLNMNVNEVITNLALQHLGHAPGSYHIIHPLDDVNLSQSTNDTYPTAFKAAAIDGLRQLQEAFAFLQNILQRKEREFSSVLKLGRTQLQDAVPMTLGQEFGAWAQAVSRDRWRFYNAEERLRSVNLGGTAIGNSIAAERRFVLSVHQELRALTGLPLAKAEDLIDATQNLDTVTEVHGIIKAGAISLIKMCQDLRLLSSGPFGGLGEISLPHRQAGSSIMPGKVNPVILEHTIQIGELVKGHDAMIGNLISAGNLELHQFMPMIAHLFLKSISMLCSTVNNLSERCISGITGNPDRCLENLLNSTAIAAILIPEFGYDTISAVVKKFGSSGMLFKEFLAAELGLTAYKLEQIIKRELGVSIE